MKAALKTQLVVEHYWHLRSLGLRPNIAWANACFIYS